MFLLWEVDEFASKDPAARNSLVIPRGIIHIKYQMNLAILVKMCREGFVDETILKIWRQNLCVKSKKNINMLITNSDVLILIFFIILA